MLISLREFNCWLSALAFALFAEIELLPAADAGAGTAGAAGAAGAAGTCDGCCCCWWLHLMAESNTKHIAKQLPRPTDPIWRPTTRKFNQNESTGNTQRLGNRIKKQQQQEKQQTALLRTHTHTLIRIQLSNSLSLSALT